MNYIIISNDELYHHGIKGMHWGVRRYQNADGSLKAAGRKRYTEGGKKQLSDEERAARNAKVKKAALIGASAVGVCLATYGGYKFSKWVNQQNVNLASHVGAEFATRFGSEIKPKVPQGFDSMAHHNYFVGQSKAKLASSKMQKLATEKVYSQAKGPKQKIKRAFLARDISKGKKTAFDVVDYDKTIKAIMQDEQVLNAGQSEFAKVMRDVIRLGGSYRKEWS